MRNLNSLLLLTRNLLGQSSLSDSESHQLKQRGTTFLSSTVPAIRKLLATMAELDPDLPFLNSMRNSLQTLTESWEDILSDLMAGRLPNPTRREVVGSHLGHLKVDLGKLKHYIYSEFSCDLRAVVGRATQALAEQKEAAGVDISRRIQSLPSTYALIPEDELMSVLDNLLQNSLQAISKAPFRRLEILIYRHSPKLRIDVRDTGTGIPREQWEQVFTIGYSGRKGTGLGLGQARETLNRYGGRIFIKQSKIGEGTTFTLELLEGQKPHDV